MDAPICMVTGSSGLVGSEVSAFLAARGCRVHGIDNNQRAVFFGPSGDTRWNQERLQRTLSDFHHHSIDVRDRQAVTDVVPTIRPGLIVHAAAQPSHERAAAIAVDDFETNALATLNGSKPRGTLAQSLRSCSCRRTKCTAMAPTRF